MGQCTWETTAPGMHHLRHPDREVELQLLPETNRYRIVIDGSTAGHAKTVEEGRRKAIKLAL
jgi:hypothetical protein